MKNAPSSMQKNSFWLLLAVHIVIGIFLVVTTLGVLRLLGEAGDDQLLGWLSLSAIGVGAGAGLFGLLLFVLAADIFWLIFFALWLVKRKMHIKGGRNTLTLP